jgi:hypothetical protein
MHWAHSIVGLIAVVGFVWHVVWGRTRVPLHRHRRVAATDDDRHGH